MSNKSPRDLGKVTTTRICSMAVMPDDPNTHAYVGKHQDRVRRLAHSDQQPIIPAMLTVKSQTSFPSRQPPLDLLDKAGDGFPGSGPVIDPAIGSTSWSSKASSHKGSPNKKTVSKGSLAES